MTTLDATMDLAASSQWHPLLLPPAAEPTPLPQDGTWPAASHVWTAVERDALAASAFSGRPLLVRGEPGVGKSQIARAAAALLGFRFVYEVITPRFEPEHLKWRYDNLRRLADATGNALKDDERHYIAPGVLWRALDAASAAAVAAVAAKAGGEPATAQPAAAASGCVLLIDEIDKADSDLPNSLLEVLANRGFPTPVGQVPADPSRAPPLLIVITSNEEREMPLAFMRRCVVLDMRPPGQTPRHFIDWLVARGVAQFPALDPRLCRQAASQTQKDRAATVVGGGARPGLAEYLDLLRAVQSIAPGDIAAQRRWLKRLGRYVLRKQGVPTDESGHASARKPRRHGGRVLNTRPA